MRGRLGEDSALFMAGYFEGLPDLSLFDALKMAASLRQKGKKQLTRKQDSGIVSVRALDQCERHRMVRMKEAV